MILRKDFEEGGEQRYYVYFSAPNDVRRTTFMAWKNPDDDDSRWIYVPSLDLVKPLSANDKKSSFVGSDFAYEDVSGRHWSDDAHTFVGEEELGEWHDLEDRARAEGKGLLREEDQLDRPGVASRGPRGVLRQEGQAS